MEIEKRIMSRHEWPWITEKEYCFRMMREEGFSGAAGLLHLMRVKEAYEVVYGDGHTVKIIDNGYYWLQLAPEDKNYWLTVMFDSQGRTLQYYFDITAENVILENGESYFYDLFLDIVMTPNGSVYLLDEDELLEALGEQTVTKEQYDMAVTCARRLMETLPGRLEEVRQFSTRYFELLSRKKEYVFYDTRDLRYGDIYLELIRTCEENKDRNWVPAYYFKIYLTETDQEIGYCDLRLGYNENTYYGGNIGYGIKEEFNGHHYAAEACLLLFQLAERHSMPYLIIAVNPENSASRKTCERLGGIMEGIVDLPEQHDRYRYGERETCIYRFKRNSDGTLGGMV